MCAVVVDDDIYFIFAHLYLVIFAPRTQKKNTEKDEDNIVVFWDIAQCTSVNRGQRLG